MPKLSIIIPVYNSEKYLDKCLESVCHQNLSESDYEIIVINDGSVDRSKEIIERFAVKYSHIVVINQENQGVSMARNAGLAIATGDYLTFVDSDDYLVKDSLKSAVCYLEEKQLDVLYCKIEVVQENEKSLYFMADTGKEGKICDGFSHPRRTYPAVFYKREMIGNLRFHEGISIGEDSLFNTMAQSFAKRVSYLAAPYYHYRDTPNSLSSASDNERKVREMYIALSELFDFENENFTNGSAGVINYFEKVAKIFITRIVQWGILSNIDKKRNFLSLQQFAKENNRTYLLDELSKYFPFINRSYYWFYIFHKISRLKNAIIHKLSFRIFKMQ